jgi:hypothetical protein
MSDKAQIYINNLYTINQNVTVYEQFINQTNFDYTLYININSLVATDTTGITGLFTNASFVQNNNNPNNIDVTIIFKNSATFVNWNTLFNNKELSTVLIGNSNIAFNTFKTNQQPIGYILLEIIAHKLFGNAQAMAAINNDSTFYLHDTEIWDQLANSVLSNQFRNDIFNQYVAIGRYQSTINNNNNYNDSNITNFNFANITFDFPLYLNGSILLDSTLTNVEKNILQNGPNIGGTLLCNGNYNIPILVKFHD